MQKQAICHMTEKEIYETIARLQKYIFGATWGRNLDNVIQEYAKLLNVEVTEMLQETNYRIHKEPKEINLEALKEEIVDIAVYSNAVASIVFNDYEEFQEALSRKVEKNKTRTDWQINK